jgi:2-oxoglutarate ferredoxin oxidoreductase subunit alpha
MNYTLEIFNMCKSLIGTKFQLKFTEGRRPLITGNEAISLGAAAGGLDVYIAYPMTPASSILHYLAAHSEELGVTVVHPENEIAVVNMAIGSAFAGARTMVGSSGGGFSLMEEAFSLAGMTETPLLCILSSRPGPSTGIPTYTSQGDLNFALYQGHGEFPRLVASPGTVEEAYYLTAEMLNLVWKFQIPAILLTEKHLSESTMTVDLDPSKAQWPKPVMHTQGKYKRYLDTPDGISPLLFPPSKEIIKWNSYEHDELGITTEDPDISVKMRDNLMRKQETMIDYLKGIKTVNSFGSGGPNIFTYGSTTMSVLEALRTSGIEGTVIQPIYLEPLPVWELEKYRDNGEKTIVVEQSSTGQFAAHLRNSARIEADKIIKRYDGRPFEPVELAEAIREVI